MAGKLINLSSTTYFNDFSAYILRKMKIAVPTLATDGIIYTIGKLLRHTIINSTKDYADVIIETKVEAIN